MTRFARFAPIAVLVPIMSIIAACGGDDISVGGTRENLSPKGPGKTLSCTGKACGTDCTAVGSKDYHWCDAQGACVPGGGPTAGAPNCSTADTSGPSTEATALPSCTGKACGTDCTAVGSKDYHWCDAQGACVPGGGPTAGAPNCSSSAGIEADAACKGKACGTDCTTAGTVDYHWCDKNGACVPGGGPTAGAPLCK